MSRGVLLGVGGALVAVFLICCIGGLAIITAGAANGTGGTGRAATSVPAAAAPIVDTTAPPGPTVRPGPTQRPTVAPTPQAKVGDTVTVGNWSYTVQSIQRSKELVWSDFGNKETAVGEFVVVLLQLTNVGKQVYPINSHDFELYDAKNIKYDTKFALGFDEWLKRQGRQGLCQQCPPGAAVDTGVLFDVAPGLTGLKLRLVQAKQDVLLD